MRYWWVNQNQTFRQETEGGYLWSPKRKVDGGRNPFYEFMREIAPGDFVFSFEGSFIRAIGIAKSNAYVSPKPSEFGSTGPNWSAIGWRVDVHFYMLDRQIKPSDHMEQIAPVLPAIYSPLQITGRGNQGVYLTTVTPMLAEQLISLIGEEAINLRRIFSREIAKGGVETTVVPATGLIEWEEHLIEEVNNDDSLLETERLTLILARRGQGLFKQNVMQIETHCRITRVDQIEHLRASHIKPWRNCENPGERLSPANGLLLTPSIDHLFDRGFISFDDDGTLLKSPAADDLSLQRMGIQTGGRFNVGFFTNEQKHFLNYHREEVFLQAKINH